jgi:hypothetical protein
MLKAYRRKAGEAQIRRPEAKAFRDLETWRNAPPFVRMEMPSPLIRESFIYCNNVFIYYYKPL